MNKIEKISVPIETVLGIMFDFLFTYDSSAEGYQMCRILGLSRNYLYQAPVHTFRHARRLCRRIVLSQYPKLINRKLEQDFLDFLNQYKDVLIYPHKRESLAAEWLKKVKLSLPEHIDILPLVLQEAYAKSTDLFDSLMFPPFIHEEYSQYPFRNQ